MADYTLTIPNDIMTRAREIAQITAQPVEQVLLDRLHSALPVPPLPPDEEAELDALQHLSDDALWTIAREQLPKTVRSQMEVLMDRNSLGTITPDEYAELERFVDRGQRLMLRKSEAAALLTRRGNKISREDLKPSE